MENRKVNVFEYRRIPGKIALERTCIGQGTFLQFGIDYEELGSNVGNYSTAIVEMGDGNVKSVHVESIRFLYNEGGKP